MCLYAMKSNMSNPRIQYGELVSPHYELNVNLRRPTSTITMNTVRGLGVRARRGGYAVQRKLRSVSEGACTPVLPLLTLNFARRMRPSRISGAV